MGCSFFLAFKRLRNHCLKHIAKLCGIELNLHFHLSRHSFGSVMATTGIDAFTLSRLMGHGSIKTTMLYVNNTLESVREQMGRSAIFD
ncbi:tyrosine-type recombinase/integrase [Flavobacterium sp. RHBU_24]|uniref:tyrosine-type recombinase/integrase n=1 Tax=Flavobacterium sp. RHBU_24 TaxID=3391185 RepID=UPI0039855AD5